MTFQDTGEQFCLRFVLKGGAVLCPLKGFSLTAVYRCVYTVYIAYAHSLAKGRFCETMRQPLQGCRKRGQLEIVISNSGSVPIYEQIEAQIKDAIMTGELAAGEHLPSIRSLANDLRVSVITTKRAYSDLEELGFVVTVQGKGTFVASGNQDLLCEERIRHVEESLERAIADARPLGLTADDLHEMLDLLLED